MDFRVLLSVLMVYQHNFRLLHWNAAGHNFNMIHEWANDYYSILNDYIDKIAEAAIRLNQEPVSYKEALELLDDNKNDFLVLEGDTDFSIDDFIGNCDIMFEDILMCIEELLKGSDLEDTKNVGIKADLESMYSDIDLQYRYINKRRQK